MSQVAQNLRGFLSRVETAKRLGTEDPLGKEFQEIKTRIVTFKQDKNYTTEVGGSQENLKKNRYKDILPYDQTRVPVTLLAEEAGSDYINASFIEGLNSQQRYIATQGPLSHTVLDFWRMIWQYNVKVIVMACREVEHGKRKCERYWPRDQEPIQYEQFIVIMTEKVSVNPEVVRRQLRVVFQREQRDITHLQYVAWPDHGIPDSYACFLEMIQHMRQYQGEDSSPMCVHCSAGCGRTGVICTVEYIQSLLQKQMVPSHFSIFEVVLEMRRQRPSAVQTKEQYEFLYHAVTEMFQKELENNLNYENLTEDKTSLYDDATSVQKAVRTLSHPRKHLSRQYSASLKPDHLALCPTENPSRPLDMASDTYAVVQKKHPTASGNFSVSSTPACASDSRCQSTTGPQYDNLTTHTAPSAPLDQLYSTVTPKISRTSAPASTPNSSYALAGIPSSTEVASVEYAKVSVPRTVEANSPSKNDSRQRLLQQSGLPASTGGIDEYEDVKGQVPVLAVCGALGFNYRIGKPKGPREPPAEWSR